MRRLNIPPGERYGLLTVLRRVADDPRGKTVLACRCDCGQEVSVRANSLRAGNTTSCGCVRKAARSRNMRLLNARQAEKMPPAEDRVARKLLSVTRAGARQRGLDFALDLEQVKTLIFKPCHYCGSEPQAAMHGLAHGGIDRRDNRQGYVAQNCVPCCTRCNFAKNVSSEDEFVGWAVRVSRHLGLGS